MDPQAPDDAQFSAWLDGELTPEAATQVEAWLRDHPEDAAHVRLWAADRDALRARLGPLAEEPVPEALRRQVLHSRPRRPGLPPRAWAAAWLLAGSVLGGLIGAGAVWSWTQPAGGGFLASRSERLHGTWTHRAAVAHAVYAPEQRHPVEVNVHQGDAATQAAQEQHLARWLSKRLDMPVRLYDLRPQGFELVGGRLLPDAMGPSAQLMYQNAAGQRVTLYLRRPEPGTQAAFAYRRDGELGVFYWVEDGFGCALVGQLPKADLLALAEAVYGQFEDDEAGRSGRPPADPAAKASGPVS